MRRTCMIGSPSFPPALAPPAPAPVTTQAIRGPALGGRLGHEEGRGKLDRPIPLQRGVSGFLLIFSPSFHRRVSPSFSFVVWLSLPCLFILILLVTTSLKFGLLLFPPDPWAFSSSLLSPCSLLPVRLFGSSVVSIFPLYVFTRLPCSPLLRSSSFRSRNDAAQPNQLQQPARSFLMRQQTQQPGRWALKLSLAGG
ncbi:hypothetical protein GALMADRAFT_885384 [Galerina marginata CBS 339.88]|uniref:Transmembrane protein n=1 Tax=Galerina marginata (strain CBS 339.88) TaxID=685588 RepID=A0A067SUN8_GALM3|nr:hypothetical protein GALMADRAFT_885384 [Galerina marginata CBS 339.88]